MRRPDTIRAGLSRWDAVRDGLLLAGIIVALTYAAFHLAGAHIDAREYWRVRLDQAYLGFREDSYGYGYSPVFALAVAPLTWLPWEAFYAVWVGAQAAVLAWLVWPFPGRWRAAAVFLAVPELLTGNVHILIAAAVYLGFRRPGAWALPILTKITPGICLVWFAVRREWRALFLALATTGTLVLITVLLAPGLWPRWIAALYENRDVPGKALLQFPLIPRLLLAFAIAAWAARTGRRWPVGVAAALALPRFYLEGFTVLLAAARLWWEDQPRTTPPKAREGSGQAVTVSAR